MTAGGQSVAERVRMTVSTCKESLSVNVLKLARLSWTSKDSSAVVVVVVVVVDAVVGEVSRTADHPGGGSCN